MSDGQSILFLGGARSGKSRIAQAEAEKGSGELVYIATAEALDAEMTDRIGRHRADRGPRWRTVECPIDLAGAIGRESAPGRTLLVDCLTLWLSNLMFAERDLEEATGELMAAIGAAPGELMFVSNEVGFGIVPENALARAFRDEAGRLNQAVAAQVDSVSFVAAGLTLKLK
ncbi:MAG: bifunctional adenosylcobinamide kinase/adenosylcobinamide-phosphate guanylyltransferase [Rhizorhabdus sp.]|nr:bifunctional adenosylcobinamide kinase/adenosylcobinamide-phosphate guanylyltransferase [Rhizorhabdus sp.]